MRTIQWVTLVISFLVLVAATLRADTCPPLKVDQVIKLPETLKINKIQWDAFYNLDLLPEEKKEWKMVEVSGSKHKESQHCHVQNEWGECCYYKLGYQRGTNTKSKGWHGILTLQEPTEPK